MLHCLTEPGAPGSYGYFRPGTRTPLFPRQGADRGGGGGAIAFDAGTLTSGEDAFVEFNTCEAGMTGVEVEFEFDRPHFISRIVVEHIPDPDVIIPTRQFGNFTVWSETPRGWRFQGQYRRAAGSGSATASPIEAMNVEMTEGETGAVLYDTPLTLDNLCFEAQRIRVGLYGIAHNIAIRSVHVFGMQTESMRPLIKPRTLALPKGASTPFLLSRISAIRVEESLGRTGRVAAEFLADEVTGFTGTRPEIATGNDAAEVVFEASAARIEESDEGYAVEITADGITARVGSPRAAMYAAGTLADMIERDESGEWSIPPAVIEDAPFLGIRGVHIYLPHRDEFPFIKRLLRTFAASGKLNTIIWEVAAGMQFERHPEISEEWAKSRDVQTAYYKRHVEEMLSGGAEMTRADTPDHIPVAGGEPLTKDEVRELVQDARDCGFEIIPEIQSLSHCMWLLVSHPELAEAPGQPFPGTMCPSNEKTYEILFDCAEEIIEVFEPTQVNIGHDEIRHMAECPRCKGQDPVDLLERDVLRFYEFYKARNLGVWMNGDSMVWEHNGSGQHFEEHTSNAIFHTERLGPIGERLPRDIGITNWSWPISENADKRIHELGYRQKYMNMSRTAPDFRRRVKEYGILGACAAPWSLICEDHLAEGPFSDMLLCGQMLWHGDDSRQSIALDRRKLHQFSARMRRRMGVELPSLRARRDQFRTVSLHDVAAVEKVSHATQYLGFDLSWASAGLHDVWPGPFEIGENVVLVESAALLNPGGNDRVTGIAVNASARSVIFLHAATGEVPSRRHYDLVVTSGVMKLQVTLGHYIVHYSDGSREEIPIDYGRNIAAWTDAEAARTFYWAPPAVTGMTRAGTPGALGASEWINPTPQKSIDTIDLVASDEAGAAGILLAALTVVG